MKASGRKLWQVRVLRSLDGLCVEVSQLVRQGVAWSGGHELGSSTGKGGFRAWRFVQVEEWCVGFVGWWGCGRGLVRKAELDNWRVGRGGFGLGSSMRGMACKDGFYVEKTRDEIFARRLRVGVRSLWMLFVFICVSPSINLPLFVRFP